MEIDQPVEYEDGKINFEDMDSSISNDGKWITYSVKEKITEKKRERFKKLAAENGTELLPYSPQTAMPVINSAGNEEGEFLDSKNADTFLMRNNQERIYIQTSIGEKFTFLCSVFGIVEAGGSCSSNIRKKEIDRLNVRNQK